MSSDLRAKIIRLASTMPKRSPERTALLRVVAGSTDGLLIQVLKLVDQCEDILPLVGTKNSLSSHKPFMKEHLEKRARSILEGLKVAMHFPPDEMRVRVLKLMDDWELLPSTVDDPGWRAVYFLCMAAVDIYLEPKGAWDDLRKVERYIIKAKM